MRIVKIDRSVFCGKLYQITIPVDYEAAIEADKGRVDIYEQVRVIKNQMAREYLKMEGKGVPREELEQLTLGSLRKAVLDGDTKNGSLMAGQVCGLVKEIKPVAEILKGLYEDSLAELAKLNSEGI